jgi:hypothetical protein
VIAIVRSMGKLTGEDTDIVMLTENADQFFPDKAGSSGDDDFFIFHLIQRDE